MALFIASRDLEPFSTIPLAKATEMISDAEAMAVLAAPCLPSMLVGPEGETVDARASREAKLAAVKAILRAAVLRWNDAGSGGVTQTSLTAGPFGSQQTIDPTRPKGLFWPSEIEQLRGICTTAETGKAFAIDTAPQYGAHSRACSVYFGAACSCGYDIAGAPIYET